RSFILFKQNSAKICFLVITAVIAGNFLPLTSMSPAEDNPGLALNPTLLEGHRHANVHGKVSNISDENVLVEQCRAQSRTAQKPMYEKYSGRMLTVCYRYLKNEDDAMEVLNNAFMKVFS